MEEKLYFRCLGRYTDIVSFQATLTKHILQKTSRSRILNMNAKLMDCFIVDKAHPNGNEIHFIFDDATVLIFNEQSHKFITILFARPGQIRRYYEDLMEVAPTLLLNCALQNSRDGKNSI